AGLLDAWFDFDADGSFDQDTDLIFSHYQLLAGYNQLQFEMPPVTPASDTTYARFRFSSDGVLSPTGLATDGEVEDYRVATAQMDDCDPAFFEEHLWNVAPCGYNPATDWGDAPEPYRTRMVDDGPRHTITPGFHLGYSIDPELDGQPLGHDFGQGGYGDDLSNFSDEDGVTFLSNPVYGKLATIRVEASAAGILDAWFDFGRDNNFDPVIDRIFENEPLVAGENILQFMMPENTTPSHPDEIYDMLTYARFRFSSEGVEGPTGQAADGEVEDYQVFTSLPWQGPEALLDFGDAPITYGTLDNDNGPRHQIVPGYHLGSNVDAETDGQPNGLATGDDLDGSDDEDGVTFLTYPVYGTLVTVGVDASVDGFLSGWFDFAADGNFDQDLDAIFLNHPVVAGFNQLHFSMPAVTPASDTTYARFRFSSDGVLEPTGPASDGEVEDYRVTTAQMDDCDEAFFQQNFWGFAPCGYDPPMDWGDAPESYKTRLVDDGPRHTIVPGFHLGYTVDPELDGQPGQGAYGDNMSNLTDEAGVHVMSELVYGSFATIAVEASAAGMLDAWIDMGGDGSFDEAVDRIFVSQPLDAGWNTLQFAMPENNSGNQVDDPYLQETYARFRFSSDGVAGPTGHAPDGEVEDYLVYTREKFDFEDSLQDDFGDAPESYSTLLVDNGPQHKIVPGFHLGSKIDAEADGQPSALANGDNVALMDDEDGVTFLTSVAWGQPVTIQVNASTAGKLDGWLDFTGDGSFQQSIDHIFDSEPLVAGMNNLTFWSPNPNVPLTELQAMARFRFSSAGGLDYNGPALDGEVEDYSLLVNHRPPHGEPLVHRGDFDVVRQDAVDANEDGEQKDDVAEGESGPVDTDGFPVRNAQAVSRGSLRESIHGSALLDEMAEPLETLDLSFLDDAMTDNSIDHLMAVLGH
ncbi:MAG: GEVED domain-containing protein, partial [Pirellulaceae bacterium]